MELYTEIEIQATADRVWQHLTNLDDFHLWNPFILSAQGIVRNRAFVVDSVNDKYGH
jgi:Polyketide cyclase / dehydrase and lipid transport